MRALLTGGTGFVGGALARALRARGDKVVALVRDPAVAEGLRRIGCTLLPGELPETDLAPALGECDALFHVGGRYRVGIAAGERPDMHRANVLATRSAMAAAERAGVARVVYVSTIGAFGDTGGRVVDETYRRAGPTYVSYYDETKHLGHLEAEAAAARGVPVVIAMPGQVYGPGDPSQFGGQLRQAAAGSLPARVLVDSGVCMVHVDDLAAGLLLAHDAGRAGEAYVFAEECVRLGEIVDRTARLAGVPPPRFTVPTMLLRLLAPLGGVLAPLVGTPPNLREAIRTGDGVTFWASSDKAQRELGWQPRPLDEGLRQLIAAA